MHVVLYYPGTVLVLVVIYIVDVMALTITLSYCSAGKQATHLEIIFQLTNQNSKECILLCILGIIAADVSATKST